MDDELSPEEIEGFRVRLEDLTREINTLLSDGAKRAQTVELDQAAVGRLSRMDALQQQKMAQAERRRLQTRLKQVGLALRRLSEDEFGECTRCGEFISRKRLAIRPESPLCVRCLTALES